MIFLRRLHRWLRALPLKERFEGELSEEFRFHLESMIEANMQAGMSQGEARRAALGRFGNPDQAKEGCRDARVLHFLEALWRDALGHFAPRGFRASSRPTSTAGWPASHCCCRSLRSSCLV